MQFARPSTVFLWIILTGAADIQEECLTGDCEVEMGSSMLQLRGVQPSLPEKPPHIPESPQLVWKSRNRFFEIYQGVLRVHLDHQDPTSPIIELEVHMMPGKEGKEKKGALLGHCGGPGSDATCGLWSLWGYQNSGYDIWGITQRGMGNNVPSFHCPDSVVKLPPEGKDNYKVSDFSSCPCRLENDTPLIGETWADIDPSDADAVHNLLTQAAKRGTRCRKSFQMSPKHNFLDFAGTQMLAHDIDALRAAINQSQIHISGVSYGTYVGGVYASTYPDRVGKLILDGNVVPLPEKTALAQGSGIGIQQSVNKLLYNCKVQIDKCALTNPDEEFNQVIDQLRSGTLTAPTATGHDFVLTVGLFGGWLQGQLADPSGAGWGPALTTVSTLLSDNVSAREVQVATILDVKCTLHFNGTKLATWSKYDKCIGDAHLGIKGDMGSGFIHQLAVLGVDLAGRYTVSDAMRLWSDFKDNYGPISAGAYVGLMAGLFQWPVVPSPPAPLGNPSVPALIVGNLYDPSTSYQWSQEMHKAFPNSTMVTWQGVGHGWGAGSLKSSKACASIKKHYMSDKLKQQGIHNGDTCRLEQELPVSFVQNTRGHLPYL